MSKVLLVNCTQYKSAYYAVSLADKQCIVLGIESLAKKVPDEFDAKTHICRGDTIPVFKSYGTLAYVNNEYNFYGILKERNKGVGIIWVSKEKAEKDDRFDSLCNRYGELLDITSEGLDVLDKSWNKGFKSSILSDSLRQFPCKKEIFYESIGVKVETDGDIEDEQLDMNNITEEAKNKPTEIEKTPIENVEDTRTEEVCDTYSNSTDAQTDKNEDNRQIDILGTVEESVTEESKAESEEKKSGSELKTEQRISMDLFNSYMSDIEARLIEVSKREEEIAKREAELIEASNKINNILANADSYSVDNIVDVILDVDIVANNSVITDNKYVCTDYTYEMILKLLHKGDCISIPFDYYSKLKPVVKKMLECNKSYNIYKVLVEISFNKASNENLVAIIDCDETINKVTIHILKPYNTDKMLDSQLKDYLTMYYSWRKQMLSF